MSSPHRVQAYYMARSMAQNNLRQRRPVEKNCLLLKLHYFLSLVLCIATFWKENGEKLWTRQKVIKIQFLLKIKF